MQTKGMKASIFEYDDYRGWLNDWIRRQPNKGRGQAQRLAAHLRISTVLISQILKGDRNLLPEYAFEICNYMGLPSNETEYFRMLVQYNQAGTESFKRYLGKELEVLRDRAANLKNRIKVDIHLTSEAKAQFYSHWLYSAIRLLTDISDYQTAQAIALRLDRPIEEVARALEFLATNGLCSRDGDRYLMAVQNTHLESDSPWVYSRQLQWRQKAMQKMELGRKEDLYYTGPMTISKKDRDWIREQLVQLIRVVTDRVRDSKSEDLYCLNVDWFTVL